MTLAERLRPSTLSEVLGQDHLTGEGGVLQHAVVNNTPFSMIFYGPPGTGKTSLALALANDWKRAFATFNASTDTKADLQKIAKQNLETPTLLLLDEIHRLDKTKQDFLLPHIERNGLLVVGSTTENPFISINPALRSRMTLLEVKPLDKENTLRLVDKGIEALGGAPESSSEELKGFLATRTLGDARSCLNALEIAFKDGAIDQGLLEQVLQGKVIKGDKDGDEHYNLLSAFQKSIRGSHVNASLHYLARLIRIGDLESICRRLSIIAYEDIGIANQAAVINAQLAIQVAKSTGFPEARIPLSAAVIELATSPKSNLAESAIDMALADLEGGQLTIPLHLRDTHFKGAAQLGHVGYQYPHDHPKHYVKQSYLPQELAGRNYLLDPSPVNSAVERALKFGLIDKPKGEYHVK